MKSAENTVTVPLFKIANLIFRHENCIASVPFIQKKLGHFEVCTYTQDKSISEEQENKLQDCVNRVLDLCDKVFGAGNISIEKILEPAKFAGSYAFTYHIVCKDAKIQNCEKFYPLYMSEYDSENESSFGELTHQPDGRVALKHHQLAAIVKACQAAYFAEYPFQMKPDSHSQRIPIFQLNQQKINEEYLQKITEEKN